MKANFLPGPVAVSTRVRSALAASPISHRSPQYQVMLESTREQLRELTGARCEIVMGSGTLANDFIAAQLSLLREPGVIFSNGEFGERLIDHALRWNLEFQIVRAPNPEEVAEAVRRSKAHWLWLCHCETSTGVLNDIAAIKAMCAAHNMKLCLDCMSSLGVVPTDLRDVYLAAGTSGKGLASYPGLGLVFSNHEVAPSASLPRALDLGYYRICGGTPFTGSSNLLGALHVALTELDTPMRFAHLQQSARSLREGLEQRGFCLVTPDARASPAIFTLALADSCKAGAWLEAHGVWTHYRSDYLVQNSWLQICLMGRFSRAALHALPVLLWEATTS